MASNNGSNAQNLPAPPSNERAINPALIAHDDGLLQNLLDTVKFEHLWRVATVFSRSQLVPDHFQGKPDNCFVALQMAVRLGVDPLMLLQKTYIVHGRPGIEATLAIALANTRGPFTGPIQWRFDGQGSSRSCTAYAVHKVTGEKCEMVLDWNTAVKEGWVNKSGSKWLSMPDQMFRYRSAMWLIRAYCPEVILGLQSSDELTDSEPAVLDVTASPQHAEPVENETEVSALLVQLMDACPTGYPEPPDSMILADFVRQTADANQITRAAVITDALEHTEGFYEAYFVYQDKARPKQGVSKKDKARNKELQERTEKIDPKTGEVLDADDASLFDSQPGA